jgi:outer membrane protein OmpA-like peptidoglycan-associated protein
LAEEKRLAEQKRMEEQRLAEEKRLAAEEQRKAEEKRLYAEAKAKIQQPEDSYTLNGTALTDRHKAVLDEKAALLQQFYPDAFIVIEGHTCNTGTHAANQRIAQKRADAVKDYLVQKGIATNRITTISKAETEPLVANDSEENRAKNRRVVIIVN